MAWDPRESDELHERVRKLVAAWREGASVDGDFDLLARDIARYQRRHVAAVRRLWKGRTDDAFTTDDIPAVPADAFRFTRVAAHPAELDVRVFRTSGTSLGGEARGEHPMRNVSTYDEAALAFGRAMLFAGRERPPCLSLVPPAREASDSSLAHMVQKFIDVLGRDAVFAMRANAGELALSLDEVARFASEVAAPAMVFATSFALVHLLDEVDARGVDRSRFALPPGSRVMQTGGFKGRSREVAAEALRASVASLFGLLPSDVVSEYGMTELSSQLYATSEAHALYTAPPWLRVTAVDPETLAPIVQGEVGIARFVDLANVDSSIAIQTADLVRVTAAGVELLGRAKGSTPRGCSLAVEDILRHG